VPPLHEAAALELPFGKFHGHTLGQVAAFEPSYIDWLATTITRDPDLLAAARVVRDDLDRQGIIRRPRPDTAERRRAWPRSVVVRAVDGPFAEIVWFRGLTMWLRSTRPVTGRVARGLGGPPRCPPPAGGTSASAPARLARDPVPAARPSRVSAA
jgi:hypothetical protein